MLCPRCFGKIDNDVIRCPFCGIIFDYDLAASKADNIFVPEVSKNVKKDYNRISLVFKIMFFIILIGFLLAYIYFFVIMYNEGGFSRIVEWAFKDRGLLGMVMMAGALYFLYLLGGKKRNFVLYRFGLFIETLGKYRRFFRR